jgi:protocatechuate 3,4-dioxygenase beta subunit
MSRKLATGLAVLVAAALAVWWFALRERGAAPSAPATKGGPAAVEALAKSSRADDPAAAPQGMAPKWALDVDPEGPLRLEGQVVDADGSGVGGAQVRLGSVPPRTTTTEADGSFAFDRLVGREYGLFASADKRVGGPVSYRLTADSDPVVIRLGEGARVVVTVIDADGKPLAGAHVGLVVPDERTETTAADGTATLEPVHPGWVAVRAAATGYAPGAAFTQIGSAGATGHVQITLRKGVAVSGRVIDEAGKPVARAMVVTSSPWDLGSGGEPLATNAKGEFAFPALAAGSHTLMATDGEHAPARSAPITVADRPVTGVELVMAKGGVVAGVVVDDAGKPVPYATVRVAGKGQQIWMTQSRQATSDQAGTFELRGLSRTQLQARAEGPTAASKLVELDLIRQPEHRDLRIVLDVSGTIAGIVVDETGQPVPEVQVNAFPDLLDGASADGLALAGMSSAMTDGAGAFAIRGLPDGGYRLWAARQSGAMSFGWGEQGVQAKTGDAAVTITLAAPGSVIGKIVIDGATAPPKLATLQLGHQASTPAARDGTFAIRDVAPGKYDLRVRGPEFAELVVRDVTIAPGKPTDVGTLTVMRGRQLTGRVVDGKGKPVAGAKVRIGDMLFSMDGAEDQLENFEEMAGMRTGITDQDGTFTLVGIGKKRTQVMADHPARGRSDASQIPAGTDDPPPVTLTLRGFGSITGRVTLKGEPAAGVNVTTTPQGGGAQLQMAQTLDDGTFTLAKVAEGTHVVSAMQQSGMGMSLRSTSVTVQIVAGRPTKVDIDIPVGNITLAIHIKALAGAKVDAAQVFLMRGIAAFKNAQELTEGFFGGGVQGMKFWFGEGKPPPEFEELVAGTYSVCTIPITGSLADTTFQQRLQEHMDKLAVHCKQVKVAVGPTQQTVIHEVPGMSPLPAD